jgi:3-methyladenine DNA glycosylase AlkC
VRPKKDIPEKWKEIIKEEYEMFRLNALYQEKTIYARCKIRIPHNTIHKVMLEFGLAKEQESKQERRKTWTIQQSYFTLLVFDTPCYSSKPNKLSSTL